MLLSRDNSLNIKIWKIKPGMVLHAYDPSSKEAETGRLRASGLQSETLPWKKEKGKEWKT
jgi:hypothetical protein